MRTSLTSCCFPRSKRVLAAKDFQHLKASAYKIESRFFLIKVAPRLSLTNLKEEEKGLSPARLGVIASRKVGPAVDRNRIKRRCKEAFRLNTHKLPPGIDIIVIARRQSNGASFDDFTSQIKRAFHKISIDWTSKQDETTA